MSEDPWIRVWLQGGDADGWEYLTLIEPDPVIEVMPDPFKTDVWIRVVGDWPQAVRYQREPSVEQFAKERIYYPAS